MKFYCTQLDKIILSAILYIAVQFIHLAITKDLDMLNEQIRETIQMFRENFPPEMNQLIEQGAGEISALDIIERSLRKGSIVPPFELKDQYGELRKLNTYLDNGPLVLTFYRGAWCPYCNLQLKAYRDRLDEITNMGATLVAVTPEKPGALSTLVTTGVAKELLDMVATNIDFDVLHDQDSNLAEQFGLQFTLPESHQQVLEAFNINVERLTGTDSYTFPDPATYVINTDGKVSWAFVPNNYRKRAEVDDILDALKQLKS